MSRPSANPDAPALKRAGPCKDGVYVVVADTGSRRAVLAYSASITAARLVAGEHSAAFPAIYCRLEGKWRLVH